MRRRAALHFRPIVLSPVARQDHALVLGCGVCCFLLVGATETRPLRLLERGTTAEYADHRSCPLRIAAIKTQTPRPKPERM